MVCLVQILDRKNNELEDLRSEHRVKVHQLESQCKKLERKGEEERREGGRGMGEEGRMEKEEGEEVGWGADEREGGKSGEGRSEG